ncbi:ABC-type transport auxiliary lipoprotein family protein [Sphingomonas xinjiangensis]|uniref:Cholesterol transport system auxiliary component n=1 Tax=Sphingomonas xinjiangensis TaxID=643568 RepID=A0A840YQS9_9SPHN|nr:ABC-type transport auxiliary lipoprotein family protein [Sphingomonas xinjiangensis]MBB5711312.1 cholesterol transport system auxiliary component [Sphingomonas xinjiangensis]
MKTRALILALPLLTLPLAGCVSFGAKTPESLLTLNPAVQLPVGESQRSNIAATITVSVPSVPQELAASRIPVHTGGTAIAYVKDAQWVERPSQLFARLLGDTISAQTGRLVLSTRQSQLDPGAYLQGELRAFGINADTGEAVVTYDAALTRGPETVIEKRRFEARAPVAVVESAAVGVALNQAANQVATQVAEWVGR